MIKPRYIGDGVYLSFDGFNVWVAVNDATNNVVAMEPSVIDAFVDFVNDLQQAKADYHDQPMPGFATISLQPTES